MHGHVLAAAAMSDENAVKQLNQIRRLPENRICGTCRLEDKYGFKNVRRPFSRLACHRTRAAAHLAAVAPREM